MFLRELRRNLVVQLQHDGKIAMQVGVLLALEYSAREIQERVGITGDEYRAAVALLRRANGPPARSHSS